MPRCTERCSTPYSHLSIRARSHRARSLALIGSNFVVCSTHNQIMLIDLQGLQHTAARATRKPVLRSRKNTVEMPSERAAYLLVEAELTSLV